MAAVGKILTIGHGALQHFSRPALSGALKKYDIIYHWLGEKLGGYRAGGYETESKATLPIPF